MKSRKVSFSTATTGMHRHAKNGTPADRIIAVGCTESIDGVITGRYHTFINPEGIKISDEAKLINGLNDKNLETAPTFDEISDDLFKFIRGDTDNTTTTLVMQNAPFVYGFLDEEIKRKNPDWDGLANIYSIVDTCKLGKELHPKSHHSLDHLCKLYKIDTSDRDFHKSTQDADLIMQVYLKMQQEMEKRTLQQTPPISISIHSKWHKNNKHRGTNAPANAPVMNESPVISKTML